MKKSLDWALRHRRSVRSFADGPITLEQLKSILWAAQGATGDADGRTAPSAGGIHPLTTVVSVGNVQGLHSGVYGHDQKRQCLVHRFAKDIRVDLERAAIGRQPWIAEAAAVLTICADVPSVTAAFVDQEPRGLRGVGYAYMEVGAALQNASLQAVAINLGSVIVAGFKDLETKRHLKLEPPIEPLAHLCVGALA